MYLKIISFFFWNKTIFHLFGSNFKAESLFVTNKKALFLTIVRIVNSISELTNLGFVALVAALMENSLF